MTDIVAQKPGLAGIAPTYIQATAADRFLALPNSKYMLHYKNGATPTGAGTFKITDATTPTPGAATPGAGFADAVVQNGGMLATTELVQEIDNSTRFRDATGFVNITHTGTLTTVSVAVIGPL
jgi:hypothetical protein